MSVRHKALFLCLKESEMGKKLTAELVLEQAKKLGVESAVLRTVIEVECKGSGFNVDNTPIILFERHVMRQRLIANGQFKITDQMIISDRIYAVKLQVAMAFIQHNMVV